MIVAFAPWQWAEKYTENPHTMPSLRWQVCKETENPTLFGWGLLLFHQVFDVDFHAEDRAGINQYLAEEHQHRAVNLASWRQCQ